MLLFVRLFIFYDLTFRCYNASIILFCTCVFQFIITLSCLHHIYSIACMPLFIIFISSFVLGCDGPIPSWVYVDVTNFVHLYFFLCSNRRLNNNSLSGSIPKSLTAITALQVL
jgi:hypothetical protein